jgi:iron complex outermembrane receptor protein
LGAVNYSNHVFYVEHSNFSTASTSIPIVAPDSSVTSVYAGFAQVNVPLVGEGNRLPLIEALNIELGYRYDHYAFGGVKTPKLAATWNIGEGFSVKGTWGKSFRAPVLGESSAVLGVLVQPLNVLAGATTDTFAMNCPSTPGHPAGVAVPGSLNAYLNPTCSTAAALQVPGGVHVEGGAGGAAVLRTGEVLGPEKSKNWDLGFSFDPPDFLPGFHAEATWYNLTITGVINGNGTGVLNTNDPAGKVCTAPGAGCLYIVRANPNLPITDPANSTFLALASAVLANPRSVVPPANLGNLQFLQDNAATNLGYHEVNGLDFNTRYDIDLGDLGAWNVGLNGTYKLIDKTQPGPGLPVNNMLIGNSGGNLRYRGRLGWTGTEGTTEGVSVTGFVNFYPHGPIIANAPPACYWAVGFSAGSCYAGSPYSGPFTQFPNFAAGIYTFDLSLGYQTGTKPANEYLQNINFQFTVNDLLNKAPPFIYNIGSGRGTAAAVNSSSSTPSYISPLQRYISFTITKAW